MATASDVPSVPESLYADLRQAIRDEIARRLQSGELPTTEQGLYVVGVFVYFGMDSWWVTPYHHTLEGLTADPGSDSDFELSTEEMLEGGFTPEEIAELAQYTDQSGTDDDQSDESNGERSEESALSIRWSPAEWGTSESIAKKELKAIHKSYRLKQLSEFGRDAAFAEMNIRGSAAIILALKELDGKYAFGPQANRDQLTLMAGSIDDEENPETVSLAVAVRCLNSGAVAEQFLADWPRIWCEDGETMESTNSAIARAPESALQQFLTARHSGG